MRSTGRDRRSRHRNQPGVLNIDRRIARLVGIGGLINARTDSGICVSNPTLALASAYMPICSDPLLFNMALAEPSVAEAN